MAILEHDVRSVDKLTLTSMHRLQFTRDQFYSIGQSGVLGDARVELIEGEIIEMAPIGPSHATATLRLPALLAEAFGDGYTVRPQLPISISNGDTESEPQPDVAVAVGSWREYALRHPGANEVVLVVEIADSTLAYDCKIKSALYAAAGIAEYWILNIADRQLEVYRKPFDSGYSECTTSNIGDSVEPLAKPGRSIAIADFLL